MMIPSTTVGGYDDGKSQAQAPAHSGESGGGCCDCSPAQLKELNTEDEPITKSPLFGYTLGMELNKFMMLFSLIMLVKWIVGVGFLCYTLVDKGVDEVVGPDTGPVYVKAYFSPPPPAPQQTYAWSSRPPPPQQQPYYGRRALLGATLAPSPPPPPSSPRPPSVFAFLPPPSPPFGSSSGTPPAQATPVVVLPSPPRPPPPPPNPPAPALCPNGTSVIYPKVSGPNGTTLDGPSFCGTDESSTLRMTKVYAAIVGPIFEALLFIMCMFLGCYLPGCSYSHLYVLMSGGERALKGEYRDGAAFPFLIKFLMGVRGYFVVIAFTITATEVRQKKGFRAFIAWVGLIFEFKSCLFYYGFFILFYIDFIISYFMLIPKLICRICCKSNKDLFCPATTKQDWLYGPYCWMYKHI